MHLLIILILFSVGCAPRPWTKEEKIMLGTSCLAVAADAYTTLDILHDEGWEINPAMGKKPSDGQVVLTMAVTQSLVIMVAHYWSDFRMWILGAKTGVNAGFAFYNYRTRDD